MPSFFPWLQQTSVQSSPRIQLPLKAVLVVPFFLQVAGAVGVTGWVSVRNGRQAIQHLAQQLMERTGIQVEQQLTSYLSRPAQINQENYRALQLGLIDQPLDTQRLHFWAQAYSYPELGYISFTRPNGAFLGVGRWIDNGLIVSDEISAQKPGFVQTFTLGDNGQKLKRILANPYEPRQEDWYKTTVRARKQSWEMAIEESIENGKLPYLGISLSQPIYDKNRDLIGVLGTDLLLPEISKSLQKIKFSPNGKIFIFQRDGALIGTSLQIPVIKVSAGNKVERLTLDDSKDRNLQTLSTVIYRHFQGLSQIQSQQILPFDHQGHQLFLQVKPWRDRYGLDWIVAIEVPVSDFMSQIESNTQQTIGFCILAALGAAVFGLYTAHQINKPVRQLQQASLAIAQGRWEHFAQPSPIQEFSDLAQVFNAMATKLKDSFTTLDYQAHHDGLTGLLNRKTFRDFLQADLALSRECHKVTQQQNQPQDPQCNDGELNSQKQDQLNHQQCAVLFLDLDYFKLVNDSLGHLVGDRLLMMVCERLKTCIRATDILARFGGDEFVILLRHITHVEQATQVAQRLINAIQQPFLLEGHEIFIDTSIGIVVSCSSSENAALDADVLLRSADAALYRAKANGRGRYELFDHAMHTDVVQRLQLETDLRRASDRQELQIYYQPIVDALTQKICGFEALMRWNHPQRGFISPTEFIPIAEETGLIVKLGWWILEQACLQLRAWLQSFPDYADLSISVNVSGKQFLQPDFVLQVEQILQRTDLPSRHLKLEITESLLMHHEGAIQVKLKQLRAMGVHLSIDDFGTGYSSLSYLHRFPITILKIDRSFIQDLSLHDDSKSKNQAIVTAIIEMAQRMGMKVIAEGVEAAEQLQILNHMGCDMAQGYLFAKPLDAATAQQMLERSILTAIK